MARRVRLAIAHLFGITGVLAPLAATAGAIPYAIQRAESGFSVGIGYLNQDYTETAGGVVLDQETGNVPLISLTASSLSGNPQGGTYWRVEGRYAHGDTNYNGHYLNGAPAQTTTANTIIDINGRVGFGYGFYRRMALIPYFSIGIHRWQRNVGNGQGAGGIEDYTNGNLGGGLLWEMAVAPRVVLAIHAMGGFTFGAQITNTDPVFIDSSTNTLYYARETVALGDRAYESGGVRATYLINRVWRTFVSVDVIHFGYGASASTPVFTSNGAGQNGYYEPNSRTTQVLVLAGAGARF
ncbi:MAG: hypothetical protein ACYCTF_09380 [Acidiferrobacter sp.]